MLTSSITRDQAYELLTKYNKEPFHIQHALTVEGVMRWYANELGHGDEADFWGIVGLLHDIDFELYPEEHCTKAPELLREGGVSEEMIRAMAKASFSSQNFQPVFHFSALMAILLAFALQGVGTVQSHHI